MLQRENECKSQDGRSGACTPTSSRRGTSLLTAKIVIPAYPPTVIPAYPPTVIPACFKRESIIPIFILRCQPYGGAS